MVKFCQECAHPIIDSNMPFCPKCGAKLPITSPEVQPTDKQKESQKPELQKNNPSIDLKSVSPSKTTPSDTFEAAISRHTGKIVAGSFIFFLLLILIVGFFLSPQNIGNTGIVITGNSAGVGASKSAPTLSVAEIKSLAQNITYDDLFRNNENYIGKTVYFRGDIRQVFPTSGDNYDLILDTSGHYSFVEGRLYVTNYKGSRFLVGDTIDVWGKVDGLSTGTSVLGAPSTIPKLTALHAELVEKVS